MRVLRKGWLRLLLLALTAVWLGYLSLSAPGITVLQLSGNLGYFAVPKSLEGWQLTEGTGDMVARGRTRLGLMHLELERTPVSIGDNLAVYVAERHGRLFLAHDDYQIRLRGELQPFGIHQAPAARATYNGRLLGAGIRMVQHDAYWQLQGNYLRVGMTFPEFLDRYFWADQYFIANYLNLAQ